MAHRCLDFWEAPADEVRTAFTQLHFSQGRGWARRLSDRSQWMQVRSMYAVLRTALGETVDPLPEWLGGVVQPDPLVLENVAGVIVGLNNDSKRSPHLPGAAEGWLLLGNDGQPLNSPEAIEAATRATELFLLAKDALDM